MKRRKKYKKSNSKPTFSKLWMNRLLWCCCLWITFSYLLAYLGYVEIAQGLSQTACTVIIGTMAPYFAKSYFETKAEKNLEFEREKYYFADNNCSSSLADESDSEAVG